MTNKYQTLYNKYRPQKFVDLIGQGVITRILVNSIAWNKLSQSYIFAGPRGTGKTSCARILSKAVNCLNITNNDICNVCKNCQLINNHATTDVIELDAASNNGVDAIRELCNNTNYLPVNLNKKVYIIDEAHMLTTSAWNALLKIVEEPPPYILFIFSTTEFEKIIPTIQSRCQKHHFFLLEDQILIDQILKICELENVQIDDLSAKKIASLSNGSLRDCLSLLEQIIIFSNNKITLKIVEKALFLVDQKIKIDFLKLLFEKQELALLKKLETIYYEGYQLNNFFEELVVILMDLIVFQKTQNFDLLKVMEPDDINELINYPINFLNYLNVFFEAIIEMKAIKNNFLIARITILNLLNPPISEPMIENKKDQQAYVVPKTINLPKPEANEELVFVHQTNLFTTSTLAINQEIINDQVVKPQPKMAVDTNLNSEPLQTINLEFQDSSDQDQLGHDNLIYWTFKNADKETALSLIKNLKQLLLEKPKEYYKILNLFSGINQKHFLLASKTSAVVIFQNKIQAMEFNNFVQNDEIVIELYNYFNLLIHWIAISTEEIKHYLTNAKSYVAKEVLMPVKKIVKKGEIYNQTLKEFNIKKEE